MKKVMQKTQAVEKEEKFLGNITTTRRQKKSHELIFPRFGPIRFIVCLRYPTDLKQRVKKHS